MIEDFTKETFDPLLNTKFRLQLSPEKTFELELVETTKSGEPDAQQRYTSFSIIFRGSQEILLPQRIYRMEHEQLGAFELFIVPIQRDEDSFYYQAVFNRRSRND